MDTPGATPRHKISLTPTQRTLLLTLHARVVDAQRPEPIVSDSRAAGILDQIEHDVSEIQSEGSPHWVLLLRARQLDEWTAEFLACNPEATVLHLACGLDSRCRRVRRGPKVRWIDVDFPDVVDLRNKVWCESSSEKKPEGEGDGDGDGDYRLVPGDVTDDEWLQQIPNNRPTAVVFEGLTPYLTEATGTDLIRRLADRFPTGQLIFDTIGPATVRLQAFVKPVRKSGASFTWAVDDPRALEKLHPRLRLRDCLRPPEMSGFDSVPPPIRLALATYRHMPYFRNFSLYLRYDF